MIEWFLTSKVGRFLGIAFAVVMAALAVRWKWTADGRNAERQAQAERNTQARKEATDARNRALDSDDPRSELRKRYTRPDEG